MVDRSKGEPLSRRLLIMIGPFFTVIVLVYLNASSLTYRWKIEELISVYLIPEVEVVWRCMTWRKRLLLFTGSSRAHSVNLKLLCTLHYSLLVGAGASSSETAQPDIFKVHPPTKATPARASVLKDENTEVSLVYLNIPLD
ncbi:hypothetical protein HZ326_10619 [Fusarium oxysporum f. sp. albedinis]|nr:hypothetical protein HZ326_10619 [Fusarium oxysporum f. sp. albedinis]